MRPRGSRGRPRRGSGSAMPCVRTAAEARSRVASAAPAIAPKRPGRVPRARNRASASPRALPLPRRRGCRVRQADCASAPLQCRTAEGQATRRRLQALSTARQPDVGKDDRRGGVMPAEPAGEQRRRYAIRPVASASSAASSSIAARVRLRRRHRISPRIGECLDRMSRQPIAAREPAPPGTSTSRAWRVASATTGCREAVHNLVDSARCRKGTEHEVGRRTISSIGRLPQPGRVR